MSISRVSQFLDGVQNGRERRSLRNSVQYRRGLGWSDEMLLHWLTTGGSSKPAEPLTVAASAPMELRDQDIPRHKIEAVIREMQTLQTAHLTSAAGVLIEMRPGKKTLVEGVEKSAEPLTSAILSLRCLFILPLILGAVFYLVSATIPVYGLLPAVLLEVMPLSFLFLLRSRALKSALVLAFILSGFYTLSTLRTVELSAARSGAIESNPEYRRLSQKQQGLQAEHDGLDPVKGRTRRALLRAELEPINDRMSALESGAKAATDMDSAGMKAGVNFLVRALLYLGSLVLTHALADSLRRLPVDQLLGRLRSFL